MCIRSDKAPLDVNFFNAPRVARVLIDVFCSRSYFTQTDCPGSNSREGANALEGRGLLGT